MSLSSQLYDSNYLKRLRKTNGSGSNLAAAGLAMMADNPLAPDEIDSVPESWVELAPSRASYCSSIEAVNAESTSGGDISVTNKDDSRLSPISLQSPHVEFESSLEQVKYRLIKDLIPTSEQTNKPTEWLWDWSARSVGGITSQKILHHRNGGQIGSTLTTPPNSPEPESSEFEFKSTKSGGRMTRKKSKFFDWSIFCRFDVLFAIVVTNFITGAVCVTGVYYYLTRIAKSDDVIEQTIARNYW